MVARGEVIFTEVDLLSWDERELRKIREQKSIDFSRAVTH